MLIVLAVTVALDAVPEAYRIWRQSGGGLCSFYGHRGDPAGHHRAPGFGALLGNEVWGAPKAGPRRAARLRVGVITQGAQLPGTGVRGGSLGEKGHAELPL